MKLPRLFRREERKTLEDRRKDFLDELQQVRHEVYDIQASVERGAWYRVPHKIQNIRLCLNEMERLSKQLQEER